jgi:hypothetical protein
LAIAAAFGAGPVRADDEPNTAMNGKLLLVKNGKLAKFISKPVSPNVFDLPDVPANDPTLEGATITFTEIGGPASLSASLPSGGWKGLGSPAGSKGFKYTGAGSLTDPCKTVLVKEKIIKAICKGAAVDMDQPVTNTVAIALTVGTGTKAYCTQFGGTVIKNDATLLKRKDSNGIDACTCGAGAPGTFTFRNGPPSASDCGDITTVGGVTSNLTCNGLYIGSGSGSLTLPETVPDSNKALVMDVECCTGETLLLRATTQADTGDIETCTSQGCKFGAPLPLPNLGNPPNSTCVLNTYQRDVTGEATCDAGSARLDAPLNSATYLTGDLLPNRCSAGAVNAGARCGVGGTVCLGGSCDPDPDIQPCPICNPTTNRCNGGPNGMGSTGVTDTDTACVADGGENVVGPQFPTSHDCAPPALNLIGTLPVPFLLSTGTQSDTALPNTGGDQQRVFCGHCRDVNGTGAFGVCTAGSSGVGTQCAVTGDCGVGGVCEAQPCESDAECSDTAPASREKCVQRNEGAFGPGGGNNMTITEIGVASADLGDFAAHDATMVSVFCIPPSFNGIIDGAADIPGPGSVSLPGVFDVNSPSGAFVDGSNLF